MKRGHLLVPMLLALLLACGGDDGAVGPGGEDGGAVSCPPEGRSCQPEAACRTGEIACEGRVSACVPTGNLPDGTLCGANQVCSAGACIACADGAPCELPNSCEQGVISCSSGAPVCLTTGRRHPTGSACGEAAVCDVRGTCIPCASGQACASANPCRTAAIQCATGAPVCQERGYVPEGTACGDARVCRAGGCVDCQEGMACTPASNPCHVGRLDCVTGQCVDTGVSLADGASCGAARVCHAGTCGSCVQGRRCPLPDVCHVGEVACETGQPVCTDTGTRVPPGVSCGVNQVCAPGGDCVACTESAACEASNPCRTAAIRCASGAPTCTDVAYKANGTRCGAQDVCMSGACAACPQHGFTTEVAGSGGSFSAMGFARGVEGGRHAAYYDATTRTYVYATDSGGAWSRQQLLANDGAFSGHVQLALDPRGQVHVSLTMGESRVLWYGTNASGAWTFERVLEGLTGPHRMAVDVAGNPHIVFASMGNDGSPFHASMRDGRWRIGRIDTLSAQDDTPAVVAAQDGSLHASWKANGKLKHGWFRGAAWEIEDVATTPGTFVRSGRGTAIVLDASAHVHIAYIHGETAIHYATNASGAWAVEVASNATRYNPDPTRYQDVHLNGGASPSLALDQQGKAHVAWVALPSGSYATFLNYATNASGAWVNKADHWQTAGSDSTALFVDEAGTVHIGHRGYGEPYSPRFARTFCPGPAAGLPPLTPATLPEVVRTPTACDDCVPSVVATGIPDGVRVDWRPVPGATGYRVYVARGEAPTKVNYATLPDGRVEDASAERLDLLGLMVGAPYFVVVTAIGAQGESAESPAAMAKPVADLPGVGFSTPVAAPFVEEAQVLENAGDIDNDGYDDLLVGDESYAGGKGRVQLFRGGAVGLSQTPAWSLTGSTADSTTSSVRGTRLGMKVAAAGDVNGDGYADVAVVEQRGVRLYHGSASGLATTPARALSFDTSIVGISSGDFDGDSFSDVVLGEPYWKKGPFQELLDGVARAYRGTSSGLGTSAWWTKPAPDAWSGDRFGEVVAAVGDVDGDGFGDLIAGSSSYDGSAMAMGAILLFRGGPTGLSQTPAWSAMGRSFGDYFGASVVGLGDLDGDTFGEVAVFASTAYSDSRIEYYAGTTGGLQSTPFRTRISTAWPYFGRMLQHRVDLLGDGKRDLFVGGPYRVALFRGRSQGLEVDPVWSLDVLPESWTSHVLIEQASAGRFGGPEGLGVVVRGCLDAWPCFPRWGVMAYATGRAQGPRIDAGWPVKTRSGDEASLSGAGLRRGAEAPGSCTVDFGDGSAPRTLQPCGDEQVGALSHRYWLPGRYTVTLSMTSSESGSSTTVDVAP